MSVARNWSRLVISLLLVAVVSVGVSDRAQPAVAATTAGCPAGTTDYYTHAVDNFGLVGSPGGSAPGAINLRDLGGHPRVLYAWSVTSSADANVSRIFDRDGSKPISSPTSGQFTTQPNARMLTFCLAGNAQPAIELSKTSTSHPDADGDQTADAPIAVPEDIDYELTATNTGNVTLTGVTIADPNVGSLSCSSSQPAVLPRNATLTCTGSTAVTIADIAAGGDIVNTASVAGTSSGTTVTDRASYDVPIADQPALTLVKTSTSNPDADGDGVADAPITAPGTIDYLLTVRNTGDVALTDLAVTDPDVAGLTCGSGLPTFLAPGASFTCTGTQTVDQSDIDAGGDIINTAVASGRGGGHAVDDRASFDVPIQQTVAITATKTSTSHPDGDGDGVADAPITAPGTIDYVVTVQNTGNVDVDLTVTDSITTLTCGTTNGLAPGSSTDCTGSYTVTQADIDAFVPIANTATVTPAGPSGNTGTPAIAGYLVPVLDNSQLTVTKTSPTHPDTDGDHVADPGVIAAPTTVDFEVVVANTGTTTITGITVTDNYTVTCPSGATFELAPGASETCTASVAVDQNDFESEPGLVNVAVASGTDGGGNEVADGDLYMVPFDRRSAITLTKVAQAPFDTDTDGNGIADTPITAPVDVAYDLVATNTGNVTLTDIAVVDPQIGSLTCVIATLAPGASLTCDDTDGATISVDQADIDAGGDLVNQATATAEDPDGSVVSDQASWDIPIAVDADLTFTKVAQTPYDVDADGDGTSDNPLVGPDTVDYTLTVENTGNVTITDITITDSLLTGLSCGPFDLDPGDSRVCDQSSGASFDVDQARIDTGGDVFNTATAAGADPNGDPVARTATWDIPIRQSPAISLAKTSPTHPDGNDDGVADAPISGPATIGYLLVATNTGNVTLSGVGIGDVLLGGDVCGPVDLDPGDTLTCDASDGATFDVTQTNIDAGQDIRNLAVAVGRDPGNRVIFDTDRYLVPVDVSPAISLEKTPRAPYDTDADGDRTSDVAITAPTTITYDLVATNTGNVTLPDVTVSDPLLAGAISCTPSQPASLAPGASVSCTGTYDVIQADIDSSSDIVNTATAGSTSRNVSDSSSWDIPIDGDPSIDLDKTSTNLTDADGDGIADTPVGAPVVVQYELVATNTGTVTLDDVSISDPLLGTLDCGADTPPVTLAPNEMLTCTGSYSLDQDDLDAAQPVLNTATATGTGEGPSGVTTSASDSFTVPVAPAPAITIGKTAQAPFVDTDGDGVSNTALTGPGTVSYDLVATNTGNVTLTDVTVTDAKIPGLVCGPVALAPGASLSCDETDGAQIVVGQSDIDAGGDLINTAEVSASFGTRTVGDSDTFDIPIDVDPELELVKVARAPFGDTDGNGISDVPLIVPQTVSYDLVATNIGNVTLSNVEIADPSLGALTCNVTQPVDLAPGEALTCSADRAIDQAAIDLGSPVVNIAVASNASGLLDTDGYVIPVQRIPGITVEKSSTTNPDTDGDGIADTPITGAGPVDYEITVTNTGNTTLTNVVIDDPMLTGCTAFQVGTLAPTESATCSDTFDVPQGLIDTGGDLVNTASGVGNAVGQLVLDRDTYDIPIDRNASIVVTKVALDPFADGDGDGTADSAAVADDVIEYVVTVTNDGNVTLSSLTPVDSLIALTCVDDSIAPGISTTCTGTYTVLQPDVDALTPIQNVASVTGTSPSGQNVTDVGVYLVPVLAEPELLVRKSIPANPDTDGDFIADDPITGPTTVDYEISVANGGTVSLTDVEITDSLLPSVTCPTGSPFDLAVGEAATCTGSFVVTQAIFDMGVVPPGGSDPFAGLVNIATAPATAPGDVTVAGGWLAGVVFDQQPGLELTKTSTSNPDANGDGVADDPITGPTTITYELTAANTGNVTLTDVTITDPLLPTLSCGPVSLAPGETLTCTGDLVVDQSDIDAGGDVFNIATASGTFAGALLADRAAYDVPISASASLQLVKTSTSHPDADGDGVADAPLDTPGTIDYRLTATNTGNTTLVNVEIDDPDLGPLACTPATPATLAPGESVVCTGSDPVTQAEIDAGGDIVNLATATGLSAQEGDIFDRSTFDVPIEQRPDLSVTKTPAEQTFTVGETVDVSWTITVANVGNVTLTELELTDVLVEDLSGDATPLPTCSMTIGVLAPGATETIACEITRTITIEEFANVASVAGSTPTGEIAAGAVALVRSEAVPPTTTPPTGLPPTGSDGSALPIAVALVGLGAVALATSRSRRSRTVL